MDDRQWRLERLRRPQGISDVVLDTDAYNEVDDQFAITYMLRSADSLNVKAICAAPFVNARASSAAEGMEKSYQEILKLLALCGESARAGNVYRGSEAFLPNERDAVDSPAAHAIVRLAEAQPEEKPLYVLAIGALTNVASALLLAPHIAKKIVLVWLGGHSRQWPDTREFNLMGDIAAARVAFESGAPIVQLPCNGVVTHLATTGAELRQFLAGKNALCDYLVGIVTHEEEVLRGRKVWSRVIWDVSAVAWMLSDAFTRDVFVPSPVITYDGLYACSDARPPIRYVYHLSRDKIFEDLFRKLS